MEKVKFTFEVLYSMYVADKGEFFKNSPFLPKCKETKIDIFGEIDSLTAPNKRLYISYLRKINDVDKLISYKVYMRTVAFEYEREVRMEMLSSDTESRHTVYKALNIPKRFWDEMVGFWAMKNPKAKEYIDSKYKGLLFYTGHRDTSLLPSIVANYYQDNGVTTGYKGSVYESDVLYLDETDLYLALQVDEWANFKYLAEVKFLAIDDAYVGGDNGYMRARLYRLIKKRMNNDLPIVIATELSIGELKTIDNRIYNLINKDAQDKSNTSQS